MLLLRRTARMQTHGTVRDPTVEPVGSLRGRIPYAEQLRTLIDSVSIAVARAQMDLIDKYLTICLQGDFRVLAAAARRRAVARVVARAEAARARGPAPG